MTININTVLEGLKEGQHPRIQKSLDKLNDILKAYHDAGHRDFSVTAIGRFSANQKGLGYQSLRATKNAHYRRLIEAWATEAGTDMKKPLVEVERFHKLPADFDLLQRLDDPALRALFGQVIAERNRLRQEVKLVKQHANAVIDKRPVQYFKPVAESSEGVQVMPAMTGLLPPPLVASLEYAISDDCMEKNGWYHTDLGQVKEREYDTEIYPRGYVLAIRKVLGELPE